MLIFNPQFLQMKRIIILVAAFIALMMCSSTYAQTKKAPTPKKNIPAKKVTSPQKTTSFKQPSVLNDHSIRILISTDSGEMIVKLYDSTPLHRDNFAKLVKEGFYDSLLFHRIIPQFMIQGGDPTSKYAPSGTILGNGGDDLGRIPAEFNPSLYHKKGALAAARDGNPEKASSACQFYIVEGRTFTDEQLNMLEQQKGLKYTSSQREIYKTIGGTPHLDQAYTVFGEVEKGIEVISKISNVAKDSNNRPLVDLRMKMQIIH
jgi:peptidyl-prolyl cis-trans isomerase B (cyclophilin B)